MNAKNPETFPEPSNAASGRTAPSARFRRRILLVDDDLGVRTSLSYALEFEKYAVCTASTGQEAIECVCDGDVDLVLLDICLPDQSGWDVAEQISSVTPFMPIIVITARSDQYEQAAAVGATAIMEKPLYFPLLMNTIQRVLEESATERVRRIVLHRPILLAGPA